jgi:uncharacterized protein
MQPAYGSPSASLTVSSFMSQVYFWMTAGILLSGFVAWYMTHSDELMYALTTNRILFFGLIIAQIGLVIWLSAGMNKMSHTMAIGMFLLYAGLNGVTLSVLSLAYTAESIQSAFFTSASAFAGLSAFGHFTKRDLGPIGSFCTMGLFGLLGFGILAMFFPGMMGNTVSQIYGIGGILVFAGLTAYDTQRIKQMGQSRMSPIMGALKLYLDFINLFIFILRMQGRRR